DLRTGLPWQMVEIHEPMRLLNIIESTPEAMLRIIDRNVGIGRLCRNGWVHLAVFDAATQKLSVYRDGRFEDYEPASAALRVAVDDYHFAIKFVFDRLTVPMVIASLLLCGTVGAFGSRYLHREPGYNRFFVLYAFFLLGMVVTSLGGTIETLFAGWELVGLSS